jgi:beta-phosphoglucomutase
MSGFYAAIFDMDGVLVDTYQAHFRSWQEMARADGLSFTELDFAPTFGRTNPEVIQCLWKNVLLDDARIEDMAERKEMVFRRIIETEFPAMPGAEQLLNALHNAGIRLAVGSSAPLDNVNAVLKKLHAGSLFQTIVSGTDVAHGKPDPEVFLLASQRLATPPSRCVVIEDSKAGVTAAKAAGMACVGLMSTGHTPQDTADADLTVASLNDLSPDLLRRLIDSKENN